MFHDYLKARRLQLGLTQKQLSINSRIAEAVICHYEKGNRLPSIKNMRRLADALNVPLDLLYRKGNL